MESATIQLRMFRHAVEVGWAPVPPQDALASRRNTAGPENLFKALLHKQMMTGEIQLGELDVSELSRMECR